MKQKIANVAKNMEKLQPFLSVSGNAKRCGHYGKWYEGF